MHSMREKTQDERDLLERARSLVPALKARTAQAEKDLKVPEESVAQLQAAGLLRALQPRAFGGYEVDPRTFFEIQTILAEIWRKNNAQVTKVIVTKKPVISFVIDPFQQTADTDLSNNAFPRQPAASRFELFEQQRPQAPANPMQQAAKAAASPMQKLEQKPGSSGN